MEYRQAILRAKANTDLMDLVEHETGHSPKRKGGNSAFFLCPMHEEKTGSFHVRGDRYHCFGCGEGGDAIDFLQFINGFSHQEAVAYLFEKMGEELEIDDSKGDYTYVPRSMREVMEDIAGRIASSAYEASIAGERRAAIEYLKDLNLPDDTIRKYGMGAAPNGKLYESAGFTEANAKQLDDLTYPLSTSRLSVTLRDPAGRAVAFASRKIFENDSPKYINSHNVDGVYNKSKTLYGMYEAKKQIFKEREVYLVEGYTDVWGMDAVGIHNACAVCSASMHEDQAKLLSRLCDRAVLIPDKDSAGRTGAVRSMRALAKAGVIPYVVILPGPDSSDPYDIAMSYGNEMHEIVRKSGRMDFITYLSEGVDDGDVSSLTNSMKEIASVISCMSDDVMREASLSKWSSASGLPYHALQGVISRNSGPNNRH